jgi:uncharacterized protein
MKRILFLACSFFLAASAGAQKASLHEAVISNDRQKMIALLNQGADVNAYDADSASVIINAAIYASRENLQLLLDYRADPNLPNKAGQTALMFCTEDTARMSMLVQHGARINDSSYSGNTAFLIACSGYGKYSSVKWLVEHGANIYAKRWNTETALMRAVLCSDTLTIGLLLEKGFDINAHPWGYSPLMYAVRFGNWAAVPFLIRHGADVNIPDEEGNPPVVWAASAGRVDVVNCLIGGTQNLNTAGSRTGMTPLMWAVYSEYDHPEIIQAFIDKGADVSRRSKDGKTALGWALQKGNTKTVALLRKLGAKM